MTSGKGGLGAVGIESRQATVALVAQYQPTLRIVGETVRARKVSFKRSAAGVAARS